MKLKIALAALFAMLTLSVGAQNNTDNNAQNTEKTEQVGHHKHFKGRKGEGLKGKVGEGYTSENGEVAKCRKGEGEKCRKHAAGGKNGKEFDAQKMARHRADRLKEDLALTDAQYEKVYALCLEQAEQMKARHEAAKAAKAEALEKASENGTEKGDVKPQRPRGAERAKMHDTEEAKLKTILTEEQFAKYKELRAQRHRKADNKKAE